MSREHGIGSEGVIPPADLPPAAVVASRGLIFRSAALAVGLQWAVRLIGILSVVVLARLLQPADFGVIAVAMTAAALVEVFGFIGLGQALLRVREPEPDHYHTAFTLQLIIFTAMAAITAAIVAPLAASFYGLPVLVPVLSVLALRFLCIGFINIATVDFERNYQFEKDLKMRVGGRLAALAVTLGAALFLRNYWALVVGMVAQSAFYTIASYLAHPYRPRFSLARRKELLGVSGWILVSAFADWLQRGVERLVLGRFSNPHTVGLYSTSKELAIIFTQEISTALNRVTFVTIAGAEGPMRDNPARVATMMGIYAAITAPLAAGLAAVADDAVVVLLGAKWIGATPYLQLIAVYTAIQAVYHLVGSVLIASGQARRAALLNVAAALLTASAVAGAGMAFRTAEAVAYAALCASSAVMLLCIFVLAEALAVKPARIIPHVLRPALAAGAMFLAVRYGVDPSTGSPFVDLVISAVAGAPAYAAALLGLWLVCGRPRGAESEALGLIGPILAHLRKPRPRAAAAPSAGPPAA